MVPKLSDLSTNVKDRSPDEPIARGASESSRFQDYPALLSGPQCNIQRCECRDRSECRGAIGSCACVARHAFNSSVSNPGMATVRRHRLPDFGDWCSLRYVRFAPESGQTADSSICPLCAISRHMQCSKEYRYSMKLRPNPSERVTLASPARLPSDLHVIYASTNRRNRQATYPAVSSKRATLLGNVDRANRKPQCGRN